MASILAIANSARIPFPDISAARFWVQPKGSGVRRPSHQNRTDSVALAP